jgi:hypothetical protein
MWALGLAATSTNPLGALALLWLAIRLPAVLAYAVDGLHGSPVLLLLTSITLTLGKARRTVRSAARSTVADPGRRPGPDHRLVSRSLVPGLVTWRHWARPPADARRAERGDQVVPARPLAPGERAVLDDHAGRRSFIIATPDWLVDHDRRLVIPRPTDVPRHLTHAVGATWWTATPEAVARLAGPLQGYRTVWQAPPSPADEPVALLAYPAHLMRRQDQDGRWGFFQPPAGLPDVSIVEAVGTRQGWGVRLAEPFDRLTRDGRLLQVQNWDRVQAEAGTQARFVPDYVRLALYRLQPGDQLERGPHGQIARIRAVDADQQRRDDPAAPPSGVAVMAATLRDVTALRRVAPLTATRVEDLPVHLVVPPERFVPADPAAIIALPVAARPAEGVPFARTPLTRIGALPAPPVMPTMGTLSAFLDQVDPDAAAGSAPSSPSSSSPS